MNQNAYLNIALAMKNQCPHISEYLEKRSYDKLVENISLFLKTNNKLIPYNKDLQTELNQKFLFGELLCLIGECEALENKDEDKIIATAISFLIFVHNSISDAADSSVVRNKVFDLFFPSTSINTMFHQVIEKRLSNLKIQRVLLGLIYYLFFNTVSNQAKLTKCHFVFMLNVLSQVRISGSCVDSNDVSDWIHILINFIHQSQEFYGENKMYLFDYIYGFLEHTEKLILIEFLRDVIELQKESNELVIYDHFGVSITNILVDTVTRVCSYVNDMKQEKFAEEVRFEDFKTEREFSFKMLLLLSDIFAVLMTYHRFSNNFNNPDSDLVLKSLIQNKETVSFMVSKLVGMLQITDSYYENKFSRSRPSKSVDQLDESGDNQKGKIEIHIHNVLYCFQTNIFKVLSNLSNKNETMRNYFLDKPEEFYYLLNHMKMDSCNPFKREWAVLLIKSLTENCYKIQDMLHQLKPLEIDPFVREYLLNKGYDIKINDGFSKPTVIKKED